MCSTLTYSIIPYDIRALGDVLVLQCVHSSQKFVCFFMNFNLHFCLPPTCFHTYAELHPPHKADSCRLLTLQNNLPLSTTAIIPLPASSSTLISIV